jgi:hypothetical protein
MIKRRKGNSSAENGNQSNMESYKTEVPRPQMFTIPFSDISSKHLLQNMVDI